MGLLFAVAALASPRPRALVVGIESYPAGSGFEEVPGSDRDARDLAASLDRLGFEVVERRGSTALQKTLAGDLEAIRKSCSEDSRQLLLFFSGRAYGRSRGDFIAPYDARSDDLEVKGIELDRWRTVCPSAVTVLLLDVPAEVRPAGTFTLRPPPPNTSNLLEIRANAPGRATHYGSSLGGRVFARSLLSGLAASSFHSDGKLDLVRLITHLDRTIRKWSFDHDLRQAPQIVGDRELLRAIRYRPASERIGEPRWQGQPISLSVKDADLQEVLRSLARLGGVNMVLDPTIQGNVTVELQDVPWDQALDLILKTHGLGAVWESSILRVDSPAEIR